MRGHIYACLQMKKNWHLLLLHELMFNFLHSEMKILGYNDAK